ncbi:helix-turn-helix transcriptional regulator [Dolosicoccus paucivorans]|uniref:HTH araC/xylS-type domain-containing protein n=1 Tax=Dolosicoccus paucivorans TaxID=84521 RepID=A0A1G8KIM1_9LACT|nr:response regulator transcription factor [Dolosicoccus paucivorans]PMB84602.1 hypothetical protein CJ206_03100 [Dolosicoccus paucivorans]PMC58213.1 hypothetical protein CJ205_05325 [Dolosicoccus paucivorans]SDI43268.1 AraC-type DNA-binding protein [Dolosicoccus paucivorans]
MCYIQLVDLQTDMIETIQSFVHQHFFNTKCLSSIHLNQVNDTLKNEEIDLIVLDVTYLSLEQFAAYHQRWTSHHPNVQFILLTHFVTKDYLIYALRNQINDVIQLPLQDEDELLLAFHRSIIKANEISLLHKPYLIDISDQRKQIIYDVLQYIHLHYPSEITLEDIASHFNFSPSYISRLFKKTTGVSFRHYLIKYRLKKAQKLLTSSDQLIADISDQVGFSEPAYFSRTFKKEFQVTPAQYRQSNSSLKKEPVA